MPYGFIEIQHTADWALKVNAPDMPGLFTQSALGMSWLMGLRLKPEAVVERRLKLSAIDLEALLITFLNEILFEMEINAIGFNQFVLKLDGLTLEAELRGAPIMAMNKSIKAVTFHNLEILKTDDGYETTIVFDV